VGFSFSRPLVRTSILAQGTTRASGKSGDSDAIQNTKIIGSWGKGEKILRTKNSLMEVLSVPERQPASQASYLVIAADAINRTSICVKDAENMTTKEAEVVAAAASRLRCPSTGLSPAALPSQQPYSVQSTSAILLSK